MGAAKSDQRIGGDRCDFEKYIKVEQVSGQDNAVHAGHHEQEQAVKMTTSRESPHIVDRVQCDRESHQADGQQQQVGQSIEPQVDADGRRPAAHVIEAGVTDGVAGHQHQRQHGGIGQPFGHCRAPAGHYLDQQRHRQWQGHEQGNQNLGIAFHQ